jgi:hypothetical protein
MLPAQRSNRSPTLDIFKIAELSRVSLTACNLGLWVVGATGIEPVTPSMSTRCSPAELRALKPYGSGPYIGSKAGKQGCLVHTLELSPGKLRPPASCSLR